MATNMVRKTAVLLCGPPLSALGGGPTHMRNLMVSPLKDCYTLEHFESGSRGTESPAPDETLRAMVWRLAISPFALTWRIARLGPAVVHLNSALNRKAFWRDLVYLLVSKLLFRKVIYQIHGGSLDALCAPIWMRSVVRYAFSLPDAVVALARSEKTQFEQMGTVKRIAVIPNAVDMSEYSVGTRFHSGRVRRLVYLGRLLDTKGIFESIEAVRRLRREKEFSDIEFHIAGSGRAKGEIERRIVADGLVNAVKLVGPLYGAQKISFLREADIFLFPSYHNEGLPYCLLESLAAGTPVVASTIAGIPDIVVDRVHGILIEPKNVDQLVDAVKQLTRSPQMLREMSRNCVRRAEQELGLERLARQFSDLYQTVQFPRAVKSEAL